MFDIWEEITMPSAFGYQVKIPWEAVLILGYNCGPAGLWKLATRIGGLNFCRNKFITALLLLHGMTTGT